MPFGVFRSYHITSKSPLPAPTHALAAGLRFIQCVFAVNFKTFRRTLVSFKSTSKLPRINVHHWESESVNTSGCSFHGNHIPNPINPPVNLCATLSGSCLAISTMLNSFLIPICSFDDVSSPELDENPASRSICIAFRLSSPDWNNSTSRKTYSNAPRFDIGGTRSSESNVSVRPSSVRTGRRDEVEMTRRRRPFNQCN